MSVTAHTIRKWLKRLFGCQSPDLWRRCPVCSDLIHRDRPVGLPYDQKAWRGKCDSCNAWLYEPLTRAPGTTGDNTMRDTAYLLLVMLLTPWLIS